MKRDILYILTLVIVSLSYFNSCQNQNNEISRIKDNNKALKDSTSYFKNKLGETVSTKLALQLSENELKAEQKNNKDLRLANEKFKKTIAIIQSKQQVEIDTIKIPYEVPVECVFNRFQTVKKDYYSLDVFSTEKGNTISNFKLSENKQTLVIGDKKESLFKNSELRAEITNSNPLFNQKKIKPFIIVYKKEWYEKPQITIPLGILTGALIFK